METLSTDQWTSMALDDQSNMMLHIAASIAKDFQHKSIGGPHILKALLHPEVGLEEFLWQNDIDVYFLNEWADVRVESLPKSAAAKASVYPDEAIEQLFEEADIVRLKEGRDFVTPKHLLVALSIPGLVFSFDQLKSLPFQREQLLNLLEGKQKTAGKNANLSKPLLATKAASALEHYCIDKIEMALQQALDRVVGRDRETRMMAEILTRRSKPNVLIVGEPGVGKTALVDGLAQAIAQQLVLHSLAEARLFELNLGSLLAGASYKGEVEDRMKKIIAEISAFDKAILFIDELHVLLDKQGAAAGVANLLKPELARGTLTVIGATTIEEYRKHIEKDEAFARRFELLKVAEPDAEKAFQMMKAVMPAYERHHALSLNDSVIRSAVSLAKRYIKDKRLPDAAIDLADRAMAALRLVLDTGEQILLERESEKDKLIEGSAEELKWHYKQLRAAVSPVLWTVIAPDNEDWLETGNPGTLYIQLEQIYEKWKQIMPLERTSLEANDIASIVADKTGIPVGELKANEQERLLRMDAILRERIVGQDHAIASITEAVLESRSGLSKPGQPIGSFFFAGPTGTGKTELAKALAQFLFQDEQYMIRFDMSEFKEEHAAAMLYGAPPGYVGYEEGGLLVNKIRQQPYSVVLFDEIEKAHPAVFDIFLQIMDEGKLHDKLGKTGDFSNALIVFTSNLGSRKITEIFEHGRVPGHTELLELFSGHFRPEFLGRLTEIIPFASMNKEMVTTIFNIQMKGLHELLQKQGVALEISSAALQQLAERGFSPAYGARPLASVIRTEIRRPLSRMLISGSLQKEDRIRMDVEQAGHFCWHISKEREQIIEANGVEK